MFQGGPVDHAFLTDEFYVHYSFFSVNCKTKEEYKKLKKRETDLSNDCKRIKMVK